MFKTSFLLPTIRDRFRDVMLTWDYPQAEFLISYDVQNKKIRRLCNRDRFQGQVKQFEHNCAELGGNVPVWNNLAKQATGDAIFVIADDIFNLTPNWQSLILKKIPTFLTEPWAVVGDDLLRLVGKPTWERGLAGHPLMSRPYYELFNYVWNPGYLSQYCDNEFYEVGTKIGRLVYIPTFVYDNKHPSARKSVRDQWNDLAKRTLGQGYTTWNQKDRITKVIEEAKKKLEDYGNNTNTM
jgi:hypothetical protein